MSATTMPSPGGMPGDMYNQYSQPQTLPDRSVPGSPPQLDLRGFFGQVPVGELKGDTMVHNWDPGYDIDPGFNVTPGQIGGPSGFGGSKSGNMVPQPSGFGGSKSGNMVPQPSQQPIMGDLGGSQGAGGPGLSHIKDYGPQVDQMQQYVQSMQQLIQQMNSKF